MNSLKSSHVRRSALRANACVVRNLLILAALLCLFPRLARAQEASIVGTATDPSGSVVPNVQIAITNTETGMTRTVSTNDSGQYVVADIHIGHYTVRAE